MIRIDHISFEFTAPDEQFAYGLHADWDGFCRRCFEQVVEECCAAHNKEKVLHEIERLEELQHHEDREELRQSLSYYHCPFRKHGLRTRWKRVPLSAGTTCSSFWNMAF